jgi:hypothetical protein
MRKYRVQFFQNTSIGCFCFLYLISCANSENQSLEKSPTVSSSAPMVASVTPVNEVLQPKQLPVLGDTATQLKFQADDAQAVLQGQARPTSPPILAVLAGNPPAGTDVCNLTYSALIRAMYDQCFPEGISYVRMSNIIGWAGEEISRSGNTLVYNWGSTEKGTLTATFVNGGLTSKSQSSLK